ncbi:HD-GYP domain-containing protein (c-di-GMP phosphodiesterase class II) [Anaerosolibacter carboniphilus]|uniref:HD-GYP domain-containing protein (C-di-GMP phosphodiesterase class II) n=1 Tax=Anaerosolibacter carboniphilus TaxID=1417629 RepID=A0A841KR07_9FIRM|nr:HD-GYP domain-containing protein [Anaerosolibacter carboniphilus]MBB6215843.1 HD-GYP domain-containing protein (c-di-GMP phosphodiesterase class II) [Anaerosolibacter carboniphilus]
MYKIKVDFLINGMILAKNIYDCDGTILLAAGVRIRDSYITKLKELQIDEVYIQAEETADMVIEDIIHEQNRLEARKLAKTIMENIRMGNNIEMKEIYRRVNLIIDDLLNHRNVMVQLCDIRTVDDYTFAHSVNVCVLSIITGISMGYNHQRLRDLGVGALLHDIGKMQIADTILNKPGELNEDEFDVIKKHSDLGYALLCEIPDIAIDVKIVALTHHERYDGSGYPFGKKSEEIHEFSRIVAVADVYDALTSDRVYKQKILPHQAMEYLIAMAGHLFDPEIVKAFIRYIAVYPLGYIVALSSGERGIIIDSNHQFPTRPKIRVVYDAQGQKCTERRELDLMEHTSIMITDVLEKLW